MVDLRPGTSSKRQVKEKKAVSGPIGPLRRVWGHIDITGPSAWENTPTDPDVTIAATEARKRAWDTFTRLDTFDPAMCGVERDEHGEIPFLRFSPEAQDHFDQWRAGLEHKIRSGAEHPAIESHLSKYRSLVPSLALLIHLVDEGRGPVGLESLQRAIHWGRYLETHARRILSSSINPDLPATWALARHIMAGDLKDGFALRDVYRPCWSGLATRDEAARGVEILVDLDWLCEKREKTPGRTKTTYLINPALMQPTKISVFPRGGTDTTARRLGDELLSAVSVGAKGISKFSPADQPIPPRDPVVENDVDSASQESQGDERRAEKSNFPRVGTDKTETPSEENSQSPTGATDKTAGGTSGHDIVHGVPRPVWNPPQHLREAEPS